MGVASPEWLDDHDFENPRDYPDLGRPSTLSRACPNPCGFISEKFFREHFNPGRSVSFTREELSHSAHVGRSDFRAPPRTIRQDAQALACAWEFGRGLQ